MVARRRRKRDTRTVGECSVDALNDYNAATAGNRWRRTRTGVSPSGSGADYHYRNEAGFLRMVELFRDLDRNDVLVGQMVDRAVQNTIQDGITPDPDTGDKELDKTLAGMWKNWATNADSCDVMGELTFHDMECLILRQVFVDGDHVALPLKEGSLQLVESHRLRTPTNTRRNVVNGVLLNAQRRRLEYWITKDDIDPRRAVNRVADITPYPARDEDGYRSVFHAYNPKRTTQTRGVSAFAPIVDPLGMFEDVNFAHLVQAQVAACFAIIREKELAAPAGAGGPTGERETETRTDGSTELVEGVSPGMIIEGGPGERLTGFSPTIPNPEFFTHAKLIITLVGINLGLPLVMVLMDASETNFSGWRGAIDQARMGFRHNQNWLINRFHRQVYLWKVRQWMAESRDLRTSAAKSGVDIFKHKWKRPTWPYIEPLKDATADSMRLRNDLISPRRLHAEGGRDFEEIIHEIVDDSTLAITLAKEAAKQINDKFPDDSPVDWREIIHRSTPEGLQADLTSLLVAGGDAPQPVEVTSNA